MNRPHKKGRVRILDSHNFQFFSMHMTHEVLFSRLFSFTKPFFGFIETTGKKAKAAPKAKVRMLRKRVEDISRSSQGGGNIWNIDGSRIAGLVVVAGFVEGFQTGMGVCVKLFEGRYTNCSTPPKIVLLEGSFKLIWDG